MQDTRVGTWNKKTRMVSFSSQGSVQLCLLDVQNFQEVIMVRIWITKLDLEFLIKTTDITQVKYEYVVQIAEGQLKILCGTARFVGQPVRRAPKGH